MDRVRKIVARVVLPVGLTAVAVVAADGRPGILRALSIATLVMSLGSLLATERMRARSMMDPRIAWLQPSALAGMWAGTALAWEGVPELPLAVALGLLAGGAAAWIMHPVPVIGPAGQEPPPGAVRMDQQGPAIWTGVTTPSAGGWSYLLVLLVPLAVVAVWGWPSSTGALVALPFLAPSIGMRITVGPQQIIARGLVGYPRYLIPISTVIQARAEHRRATPLSMGWYMAKTRLITRTGPVLVIDRSDGGTLTVSMQDAEQAAAVINSMADREHRHASHA